MLSWRPELQALKMGNVLTLGYSGPPMRRPVASNEVRWLARALVRASDAANAALGLDQPPGPAEQQHGDALQVRMTAIACTCQCSVAFLLLARCWRPLAERIVQLQSVSSCLCTAVSDLSCHACSFQWVSLASLLYFQDMLMPHWPWGIHSVMPLCAASQGTPAAERGHQPAQPLGHLLGRAADAVLRACAPGRAVAAVEVPGTCLGGHHPSI